MTKTIMPRDIKQLIAEVEKRGFAIGDPIPIDGATADLFGNLQRVHPDQCLLHYMPVGRFESLIANKALYLRRLDLFEDDLEGKVPAANDSNVSDFTERLRRQFGMTDENIKAWKHFITVTLRTMTYVHCWFASEVEDATMWRDYGDAGRGVCIETTAGRLLTALRCPNHLEPELRRITYTDEKDAIPEIVASLPVGRKRARPEFMREKEVRLVATISEQEWAQGFHASGGEPPSHQLIPVNTSVLFETVRLGLQMTPDVAARVERIANEAVGHAVTCPAKLTHDKSLA